MNIHRRIDYRLVLAIDVESYSARSARDQLHAQNDLAVALDAAATQTGLDRSRWHRQGNGDGELAVLPEQTDVAQAVGTFPSRLHDTLADLNATRHYGTRLRARLALHHGTLTTGPFGPVGDAPIVVSRLLDAKPLRRMLAEQPGHDLALAISGTLFADVVRTGFCCFDPAEFDRIQIVAKGTIYHAYIHRDRDSMSRAKPTVFGKAFRPRLGGPLTAEPSMNGLDLDCALPGMPVTAKNGR